MIVLGEAIHEDECPCDGHKCGYDCKLCECSQEWKDADIRSAHQKELDDRVSREQAQGERNERATPR